MQIDACVEIRQHAGREVPLEGELREQDDGGVDQSKAAREEEKHPR